jgi:hypothetical protein
MSTQNVEDQFLIRDLHSRYADVCSRKAFGDLHDLILPDAQIVLDLRGTSLSFRGPNEIGTFIAESLEAFDFFQFVIRNSVVTIDDSGEAAGGRLWMSEMRRVKDTGMWSTIFGVYHDQYLKDAGSWMIAGRRYHSLARLSHGLESCDVFDFPEEFNDLI